MPVFQNLVSVLVDDARRTSAKQFTSIGQWDRVLELRAGVLTEAVSLERQESVLVIGEAYAGRESVVVLQVTLLDGLRNELAELKRAWVDQKLSFDFDGHDDGSVGPGCHADEGPRNVRRLRYRLVKPAPSRSWQELAGVDVDLVGRDNDGSDLRVSRRPPCAMAVQQAKTSAPMVAASRICMAVLLAGDAAVDSRWALPAPVRR